VLAPLMVAMIIPLKVAPVTGAPSLARPQWPSYPATLDSGRFFLMGQRRCRQCLRPRAVLEVTGWFRPRPTQSAASGSYPGNVPRPNPGATAGPCPRTRAGSPDERVSEPGELQLNPPPQLSHRCSWPGQYPGRRRDRRPGQRTRAGSTRFCQLRAASAGGQGCSPD